MNILLRRCIGAPCNNKVFGCYQLTYGKRECESCILKNCPPEGTSATHGICTKCVKWWQETRKRHAKERG